MKKFLFLVFSLLVAIFVTLFGISAYQYYTALHIDDPIDPYVSVLTGEVTVVRGELAVDMETGEIYRLREWDVILTKQHSEATIFWSDHSTTHLAPESKLVIERMRVTQDYASIELIASLERGKIWTNIVRTLYPGSEIRIKLPHQGVVAGVRGTVFEINLDSGYIHSLDHVVTLTNQFFQSVTLFPGEIASIWDIVQRHTYDVLDMAWNHANTLRDQAYELTRAQAIREAFDRLSGMETGEHWWDMIREWWDGLVRQILSWFSAFEGIEFFAALREVNTEILASSESLVFEWYQKLRGIDFARQRDILRGVIHDVTRIGEKSEAYFQILVTESLWDKIEFPALSLPSADEILVKYTHDIGVNLTQMMEQFTSQNYGARMMERIFSWMRE